MVSKRLMITKSIRSGSIGLKVGLICEGRAHLYLDMSGRTSQWDTCAPAALLQEAGGRITDLMGIPLRYNGPELRHLNGVIASNGTIQVKYHGKTLGEQSNTAARIQNAARSSGNFFARQITMTAATIPR